MPLDIPAVRGLLPRGGTILGSSRTNPFAIEDGVQRISANLQNLGVDALIAIGGEDTLGVATQLHDAGVNVVGVPKTIDNDLGHGLHVRVRHGRQHRDRGHRPPAHHRREPPPGADRRGHGPARRLDRAALGHGGRRERHPHPRGAVRHRPGLRLRRGPVPDRTTRRSSSSPRAPSPRRARRRCTSGEKDAFGHVRLGGIGEYLAREIESRTGKEARTTVLGHVQRGGTPTARDRWLATRFGLHAIDAVAEEKWGMMTALRGTDIVMVPLAEATKELKVVDPALMPRPRSSSGSSRAQAAPRGVVVAADTTPVSAAPPPCDPSAWIPRSLVATVRGQAIGRPVTIRAATAPARRQPGGSPPAARASAGAPGGSEAWCTATAPSASIPTPTSSGDAEGGGVREHRGVSGRSRRLHARRHALLLGSGADLPQHRAGGTAVADDDHGRLGPLLHSASFTGPPPARRP